MSVTVQSIIQRARFQLVDELGVRWTETELMSYINDAQREIVLYKPDAIVRNEDFSLSAGAKQTLPTSTIRLLSVVKNSHASTERSVRPVSRETLDRFKPNWHSETQNVEVQHFVFDDLDQEHFYVYPPNDGNGSIEIQYTKHPTTLQPSSSLEVADAYANSLLDYVLYRAFAKDGDIPSGAQRSANHFQAFMGALTGKQTVDSGVSPREFPENPTPGV